MTLEMKNGELLNIRARDIGTHLLIDARDESVFMQWAQEQDGEWSVDTMSFDSVLIFEKAKNL